MQGFLFYSAAIFVINKCVSMCNYLKFLNSFSHSCICFSQANRVDIFCCVKLPEAQQAKSEGCLFQFFKKIYAPFILMDWVRPLVVRLCEQTNKSGPFIGCFFFSNPFSLAFTCFCRLPCLWEYFPLV